MSATRAPIAAPSPPSTYMLARASCVLAIFTALLGSTAPSPLYPIYLAHLQADHGVGTVIYAMYSLGTLVALMLTARIGGRVADLRRIILPGLAITAAGALIFARSDTLTMLLVGRCLNGIGTGLITGMASTALYDLTPEARRGTAATVATVAFTGGAAGGPMISSAAIALGIAPTVTPFVVIALFAGLAFAGLMRADWPRCAAAAEQRAAPVPAGRARPQRPGTDMPSVILGCLGVTAAWMLGSQLMAMGSMLAQEVYGVTSASLAGLIPALFQLTAGAGQTLFGRFSPRRPVVMGLGGLAAAQVALVMAAPGGHALAMFLLVPLCGIAYGATFVGALGLVSAAAAPERRANLVSRFYIVGYLANAIPTMVVGKLSDIVGLAESYYIFTVALVLVAVLSGLFGLRPRQRSATVA